MLLAISPHDCALPACLASQKHTLLMPAHAVFFLPCYWMTFHLAFSADQPLRMPSGRMESGKHTLLD